MHNFARQCVAVLLLPALAGLAGCSGKGEISGKVTYQGKDVPSGRVTFLSDVGDHVFKSAPITDGHYTIAEFPTGPAKIAVETFPPVQSAGVGAPPPTAGPATTSGFKPPKNGDPFAAPSADKYVRLPPNFANTEKSGLKYDVKDGKQDHPIDLGK